jgi:hypothetical protein
MFMGVLRKSALFFDHNSALVVHSGLFHCLYYTAKSRVDGVKNEIERLRFSKTGSA